MKPTKTKLLTSLTALVAALMPSLAQANFYDGVRGPSKAQIHYTLSDQKVLSHTLAGKYFGEELFAVGAASVNGESFLGSFAGVGYIAEEFKRIKAIPVVGYGLSGDGKQGTLNTILQATAFLDENGTFLADPRYILSVPMHGQENHTPAHTFGLTLSAGNERVRVGPDFNYSLKEQKLTGGALLRYDIDATSHSSWVELGFGTAGGAQLQFRGNF
ncbi:hypothetical protein HZC30_03095 [Candidatus Woesearchaeota archaeon]|nr:hypothetical protein [Candidatus Woesearchaeota archaeon]